MPASLRSSRRLVFAILLISVSLTILAIYQWKLLFDLERDGAVACAINEVVDCGSVWSLPLAKQVVSTTGLPVAGWGVAYGVVLVALSLGLVFAQRPPGVPQVLRQALHVAATIGAVSVIGLAGLSFASGVVCLTCVFTYLLVGALVFSVWRFSRAQTSKLVSPVSVGGTGILFFVAAGAVRLLGPEPAHSALAPQLSAEEKASPRSLAAYLEKLSALDRDALRDMAQKVSRQSRRSLPPSRFLLGDADAAVKILDFSDLRCGHCRALFENLREVKASLPPGVLATESRYFPLDPSCNSAVQFDAKEPGAPRCQAALALLCLENKPEFKRAKEALFQNQETLTSGDRVWLVLKNRAGIDVAAVQACVASEATQRVLAEDIRWANQLALKGTPMVFMNGRQVPPTRIFLEAAVLARGDLEALSKAGQ